MRLRPVSSALVLNMKNNCPQCNAKLSPENVEEVTNIISEKQGYGLVFSCKNCGAKLDENKNKSKIIVEVFVTILSLPFIAALGKSEFIPTWMAISGIAAILVFMFWYEFIHLRNWQLWKLHEK